MTEYYTRMGDGKRITMTKEQIMADLQAGTADAADMGEIPALSSEEMEQLFDIISDKNRIVGVEPGKEVVLTYDIGQLDFTGDNGNSGNGVDMGRLEAALLHERALGADTFELAHADYSIKPVKPIIANEMQTMEEIQNEIIAPYFYGAMPNMGLYYAPDGPYGNPADLMREFKLEESMASSEAAAEHLARDIEYVSTRIIQAGADGFNFDTTASAGDADFVGTLRGVEAGESRLSGKPAPTRTSTWEWPESPSWESTDPSSTTARSSPDSTPTSRSNSLRRLEPTSSDPSATPTHPRASPGTSPAP